jgi:hypothetical protein
LLKDAYKKAPVRATSNNNLASVAGFLETFAFVVETLHIEGWKQGVKAIIEHLRKIFLGRSNVTTGCACASGVRKQIRSINLDTLGYLLPSQNAHGSPRKNQNFFCSLF